MANTRFNGTYQFEEIDRMEKFREQQARTGKDGLPPRPLPHFFNQYALSLIVKGELEFKVGDIEGKLSIDTKEVFAESNYKHSLRRRAIHEINDRGVEKMIKKIIIDAIKQIRREKDNKITEAEYNQLIASASKVSIELNLKTKDIQ